MPRQGAAGPLSRPRAHKAARPVDAGRWAAADPDIYLRISSHLAGKVEIREALRSVKAEIARILPLDHLDVCLMDDEKVWNTSYEVGLRTRWSLSRSAVALSPIRDILLGEVDHMLASNAMEDPRYTYPGALSQPIIRHELRSRVNVAMKVLGRTIGSLNCSCRTPGVYDAGTVDRVRHVAAVLAPYFYALRAAEKAKRAAIIRAEAQAREEGLRLGALQLTQTLEQERQRIGMDLHDQTLADLTRIMRDVERGGPQADGAAILARLRLCVQDLRRIIDTAVPTLLELFGFAHAVRIHLERAVGAEPIAIAVIDETGGLPDRLDPTTRIALFRIVQEAINNAARHARARRIDVRIAEDDGLRVTVADDGRGLGAGTGDGVPDQADTDGAQPPQTQAAPRRAGQGGLAHMRTRARLIAADFDMDDARGTTIRLRVPAPGTLGGPAVSGAGRAP